MNIDLSGRIALVTGGAGELGRTMARTFAECGADVAVHYHTKEKKAREVADSIVKMGRRAVIVKADVGKLASVSAMRKAVAKALGNPDIVVANAVAQYGWKTVLEQAPEDYVSQFETCVMQAVNVAKVFVPAMIAKRRGRIIAINTDCAMQNFPSQSAYVAGKRGMDGVYRVLAREVGSHGITVNQVAPGWTVSDRARAEGSEKQPAYEANIPLRRRGTDQEIANMVAFLASDLAGFTTGAYIPVCGGTVMPAI
jgi:3-oxoacyl-[acyl-carrier protein] reductase